MHVSVLGFLPPPGVNGMPQYYPSTVPSEAPAPAHYALPPPTIVATAALEPPVPPTAPYHITHPLTANLTPVSPTHMYAHMMCKFHMFLTTIVLFKQTGYPFSV